MVSFRIDGVLQLQHVLPAALHVRVASAIKVESGMDIAESRRPQDGSFALNVVGQAFDLRVSSMPTTHGENLVVRILSLRGDVLPLDKAIGEALDVKVNGVLFAKAEVVMVDGKYGLKFVNRNTAAEHHA